MNGLAVATSIAVSLLAGCATAAPSAAPTQTPANAFGGTVHYEVDGAPASTEVDAVGGSKTVSGTAVTTLAEGTHTVRLACASRNGDTWTLGGTTERTTVPGERAGDWSAVIVKAGSPQQIAIWLSDDHSVANDCATWLAATDFASIDAENFSTVESGALVPPSDLAP